MNGRLRKSRQRMVAVLLLRALMHEFTRVSQAIIHAAAESKKTPPTPQIC